MQKYLLLPVEEKAGEARLSLIANNQTVQTITVRLAVNQVDYYVPFELNGYDKDQIVLDVHGVKDDALCWKEMKLSDSFDKEPGTASSYLSLCTRIWLDERS